MYPESHSLSQLFVHPPTQKAEENLLVLAAVFRPILSSLPPTDHRESVPSHRRAFGSAVQRMCMLLRTTTTQAATRRSRRRREELHT